MAKKQKMEENVVQPMMFSHFSLEIISSILDLLPVWKVLQLECLSRKFQTAVLMSLKLRKRINFFKDSSPVEKSNDPFRYMTDVMFGFLLIKMPNVTGLYNLSPAWFKRSCIHGDTLSLEGVVSSLALMPKLAEITTNNSSLLEAVSTRLPKLDVNSCLMNDCSKRQFPPDPNWHHKLHMEKGSNVTQFHFVKCCVLELPPLPRQIKYLSLKMVRFLNGNPFQHFDASLLETFVMSHCVGPLGSLMYIELLHTLAQCRKLKVLELARVPLQEGMWRSACRATGCALESLSLGDCLGLGQEDLLYLIMASRASLRTLRLHKSIPTDALMDYLTLKTNESGQGVPLRHLSLGWKDTAIDVNEYDLVAAGVCIRRFVNGCRLTDIGIRKAAQNFQLLETLELADCPYLVNPVLWHSSPECMEFSCLQELTLEKCCNVNLAMLTKFLTTLPCLESLSLENIAPRNNIGLARADVLSHIHKMSNILFPKNESESESEDHLEDDSEGEAKLDLVEDSECVSILDMLDDSEYDSQTDPDFEIKEVVKKKNNKIVKSLRTWSASHPSADIGDTNVEVPGETQPCSSRSGIIVQQPRRSVTKYWRRCPDHKKQYKTKCSCVDKLLESRNRDLKLDHSSLTRLYIDNVDFTMVDIVCPKMRTVCVTNCSELKTLKFTLARNVVGVNVSGCPKLDETKLMSSLSRQPVNCSRMIILKPMHYIHPDYKSFSKAHMSKQHGSLFLFYIRKDEGETVCRPIAPRVLLSFVEYFTKVARAEFTSSKKTNSKKGIYKEKEGVCTMMYDVPWLKTMHDYMNQEKNIRFQVPSALQVPAGVMLRDHQECLDELRQEIKAVGNKNQKLYQHNVITYVDMTEYFN